MCRIMYFQSGIGAQQQRLKLPDGRVVQLEGPDAEKSLVIWQASLTAENLVACARFVCFDKVNAK